MRRTRIQDYKRIKKADDLDEVVHDKRRDKRATKKKAKRRNRHYEKDLLRQLRKNFDHDID